MILILILILAQFLTLLSEENDGVSSGIREKELALLKIVDATMLSIESSVVASEDIDRSRDYETKCRERCGYPKTELTAAATDPNGRIRRTTLNISNDEEGVDGSGSRVSEKPMEEGKLLTEERKIAVLYELLSSCLAGDVRDDGSKGYDARHRVALRLLATWLNIKWIKMVCALKHLLFNNPNPASGNLFATFEPFCPFLRKFHSVGGYGDNGCLLSHGSSEKGRCRR